MVKVVFNEMSLPADARAGGAVAVQPQGNPRRNRRGPSDQSSMSLAGEPPLTEDEEVLGIILRRHGHKERITVQMASSVGHGLRGFGLSFGNNRVSRFA